jgi:hypothetical protein
MSVSAHCNGGVGRLKQSVTTVINVATAIVAVIGGISNRARAAIGTP